MASRRPRPRRLLLPIMLAAALAAEITGIAIARTIVPTASSAMPSGNPITLSTMSAGRLRDDLVTTSSMVADGSNVSDAGRDPRAVLAAISHNRPSVAGGPAVEPASPSSALRTQTAGAVTTTSSSSYRGRNHVWIPSLGINRSVSAFPCSRTRPPDNYIYRWGCAGRNNVYLLGHAYSVFKPLHDAYTSGRLRKGMKVVYADGGGRVHTYAVTWWRVVAPTTAAKWAWAAQSRPSMTLQTCVGSRSQYRLMVRLVRVG